MKDAPVPDTQKSKGKHVTTACATCRKKKIKCDATRPRCSNCQLYDQECIFPTGPDKRKIPSKERIAALTAYVESLETLLRQHGIPFTPLNGVSTVSNDIPAVFSESPPLKSAAVVHDFPGPTQDRLNDSYDPKDWFDGPLVSGLDTVALPNIGYEQLSGSSEDEALVDQLTGRMGSLQIAEDGQKRFYGATSNLHILHNGPMSLTRAKYSSLKREGQSLLESRDIGHFVDADFEEHLLRLYFCWEDPVIHVMDEMIFFRERAKCKATNEYSHLYSEVLVNAMCSIGATMTTRRRPDLPEPLDDFFAARSKTLLEIEMDSPSLSTVQSLVILSAIEAALTRDARGWIYSGMAVRLSSDLGLHLNVTPHVEAGLVEVEEAMVRNLIWWGVFTHDRMWSLYMGRPVAMDDKHITAQPPASTTTIDQCTRVWKPYTDDSEEASSISLLDPLEDLSKFMANLCAKMGRIRETLYSDSHITAVYLPVLYSFASAMSTELQDWYNGLPDEFKPDYDNVNQPVLPHVLQLHMQYQCILIILTRPFLSSTKQLSILDRAQIMEMRAKCLDAARSIARLLRIYRRMYTLRRMNVQAVHLVFTASLILVCSACGAVDPGERAESWPFLETCCQALGEMGQAFKNSTRALEVITCIKAELLKNDRKNRKRSSQSIAHHDAREGKKRRPTNASQPDVFQKYAPIDFESLDGSPESFDFSASDIFSFDSLLWNDYNTIELVQNKP